MAKAKKTTPAAPKKKSAAPSTSDAPMIDTAQAAMAAANLVKAKTALSAASGAAPMKESAAFKNLKDSVNKPSTGSMANFLNDSAAPEHKKSNLPAFGGKQVGRNQTFGADVNRTGVPRRTGGG